MQAEDVLNAYCDGTLSFTEAMAWLVALRKKRKATGSDIAELRQREKHRAGTRL